MSAPHLTLIPSVPVWEVEDTLVFDRKFHDGLMRFVETWPGPVRCLAWRGQGAGPSFGQVRLRRDELPFVVTLMDEAERVQPHHLAGASVVLAAADDHRQLKVAALCRAMGIGCAYVIEYVPETRHQINRLEAPNRWLRWRRDWFLRNRERARQAAFRACSGLQANGLPAFETYRSIRNRLLYFDTRVSRSQLISEEALEARLQSLRQSRPLRLAFSGRLISMKGADHLIEVAARAHERGACFDWTVFGTGELEAELRARVHWLGLADIVRFPGAVDFESELLPALQSRCDLFVMLHRQSDPSCTYLETLACGIPIVGYDNRAFAGLLQLAQVGVQVPMDRIDAVVDELIRLDRDRDAIEQLSRAARAFALQHAFEDCFQRRIDHLLQLAPAS